MIRVFFVFLQKRPRIDLFSLILIDESFSLTYFESN